MYPASTALQAKLTNGPTFASRVCIFWGSVLKEDTFYGRTNLTLLADLSSLMFDRLADTRATAELSFQVVQTAGEDLLDPTRFPEAHVYIGVLIGNDYEWVPMGVFGIHTTVFQRSFGVVANCSAADRSARIRDNKWRRPYQIASGTDYYTAMNALVADRAVGFTPMFNVSSSALTTPTTNLTEDSDPWVGVLDLAKAVGAEAYFDREGGFCAFPVPDPLYVAPSLVIGPASGIQISPISREISNRDVYNGVICRAEAPWLLFPVQDEYWDTDPLSPSYRYGSFGEKPKTITDAIATTQAQCLAAATAEFNKIAGVMEKIDFQTIKNPCLDVGDIIESLDDGLQITGRYVLDSMQYPLGKGAVTGTVRRKR